MTGKRPKWRRASGDDEHIEQADAPDRSMARNSDDQGMGSSLQENHSRRMLAHLAADTTPAYQGASGRPWESGYRPPYHIRFAAAVQALKPAQPLRN